MTLRKNNNDIRCPVCYVEFNEWAIKQEGHKVCPNCKSTVTPLLKSQDGYVYVNWGQLRIMATYAKRWTTLIDIRKKGNWDMVQALDVFIKSLGFYKPNGALQLILEDDLKNLPIRSPYYPPPESGLEDGMKI